MYGIHLKSNLGNPPDNTSKREDAVEQLLGHIQTGRDRVPPPDAIVIAGDFDTDDPDSPAGQSPGERTFDLMRKAGFHWTFDGIPHRSRITCPGRAIIRTPVSTTFSRRDSASLPLRWFRQRVRIRKVNLLKQDATFRFWFGIYSK